MNFTEFINPGFLLSFFIAVIGFIAWLVRVEGKTAGNAQKMTEIEKDLESIWKEFEAHRLNALIHFDKDHSRTVQLNNEKQFTRMELELTEIKNLVMRLLERK